MSTHLEQEIKLALSAAEHAALAGHLRALLGGADELDQDNRFYDSDDLRLRAQRRNIRLRRENDRVLLTCKARVAGYDGVSTHEEWEVPVDPSCWLLREDGSKLAAALPPLPAPVAAALGGRPLVALGGFANMRQRWRTGSDELCLDATTFQTGSYRRVDYELEIETQDPLGATRRWRGHFESWSLPWTVQPLTKFARFAAMR